MGREARLRRARRALPARPSSPAPSSPAPAPSGIRFETRRQCRICRCSCDDDPCWEQREVPHPLFAGLAKKKLRQCFWVGPDLCSFCAADGGPGHEGKFTPDDYSGLVDRFGQPLLKWRNLPR